MKFNQTLLPIFLSSFLSLLIMCTACKAEQSTVQPDVLQVTGKHTWTITDRANVQQLFAEMQSLPLYKSPFIGGHGPACINGYTLTFWAGTKKLQEDQLETGFCSFINFSDGSTRTMTATFKAHLAALLHISVQQLSSE